MLLISKMNMLGEHVQLQRFVLNSSSHHRYLWVSVSYCQPESGTLPAVAPLAVALPSFWCSLKGGHGCHYEHHTNLIYNCITFYYQL